MAYIGVGLDRIQTVEKLDNITFNGGSTYNLTKGSTAFTPIGADHIICSINGVVQFGNFTVSGSTITFTGATLTASDTMDFIFQIGTGVALTPNNGSVTADKLSTSGISAGQVFKVNDAGTGWELGNASSAEVYGFSKNSSGELIVTTTNQGQDNISSTDYANFDDVQYAASGFTWSLNNGELIATI
jgi:hypothetical protein